MEGLDKPSIRILLQRTQRNVRLGAVDVTPMVEKSKLDEDKDEKAVDPSHYRGMISTLLYLTASRPDLQFCSIHDIITQARDDGLATLS
ncbi:hypothetical protein Tco_0440081 [Tanacetum coccineum]